MLSNRLQALSARSARRPVIYVRFCSLALVAGRFSVLPDTGLSHPSEGRLVLSGSTASRRDPARGRKYCQLFHGGHSPGHLIAHRVRFPRGKQEPPQQRPLDVSAVPRHAHDTTARVAVRAK